MYLYSYSLLQFSVALNFAYVISLWITLNFYSIYHCASVIYVHPYHNNEYVPKSNSKFLFCFSALSEIRITLQIIFHTIQNTIKSFYIHSVKFSELIGIFCQYFAQFKILSISFWFPKLMHPPSSSVRIIQAKVTIYQQKFVPVIMRRVHHVMFTSLTTSRLGTRSPCVAISMHTHVGLTFWRLMWTIVVVPHR